MRRALLGLGLVLVAMAAAADPPVRQRMTPAEFDFTTAGSAGAGTSGIAAIQTIVLKGNPTKPGLYTIMLRIPANTRIAAHTHPDDRIGTVISGTWYLGYGKTFDANALKSLPPGSFYTEPPNDPHFAETGDSAVVLQITGYGPTGTTY
ncbi:MAG: cupin domain-containing protein [Reyranella sp.]|uniref:cupin domain-containing protein n=1 Tax=Reyranella sp. TaxID=1929291 RepID=UPI002730D47B|nr:cupin domain-containing protein [Reyranella sp.]MDP1963994.1 cupin domain-containing protein [Reyranella sp.]MDP2378315.1 cupin domain-containing protein [Reyranella sp.]